jgi:hypothetical protein
MILELGMHAYVTLRTREDASTEYSRSVLGEALELKVERAQQWSCHRDRSMLYQLHHGKARTILSYSVHMVANRQMSDEGSLRASIFSGIYTARDRTNRIRHMRMRA